MVMLLYFMPVVLPSVAAAVAILMPPWRFSVVWYIFHAWPVCGAGYLPCGAPLLLPFYFSELTGFFPSLGHPLWSSVTPGFSLALLYYLALACLLFWLSRRCRWYWFYFWLCCHLCIDRCCAAAEGSFPVVTMSCRISSVDRAWIFWGDVASLPFPTSDWMTSYMSGICRGWTILLVFLSCWIFPHYGGSSQLCNCCCLWPLLRIWLWSGFLCGSQGFCAEGQFHLGLDLCQGGSLGLGQIFPWCRCRLRLCHRLLPNIGCSLFRRDTTGYSCILTLASLIILNMLNLCTVNNFTWYQNVNGLRTALFLVVLL